MPLNRFSSFQTYTCKIKTKGRQIWPPHQATKGPATPLPRICCINLSADNKLWQKWCPPHSTTWRRHCFCSYNYLSKKIIMSHHSQSLSQRAFVHYKRNRRNCNLIVNLNDRTLFSVSRKLSKLSLFICPQLWSSKPSWSRFVFTAAKTRHLKCASWWTALPKMSEIFGVCTPVTWAVN